jgi:cytochrome c biogenesis protein CcdA
MTVSYIVAFLGGILSLFSPCILSILPVFFACTFKEKRRLLEMSVVFFFGFSLVFTLMGLAASGFGGVLMSHRQELNIATGSFLVLFGIMSLLGKGFSLSFLRFPWHSGKHRSDIVGTFLLGVMFAVGWSPCIGPILGSILLIASTTADAVYGAALLFVYSLGIFIPMFLIAFMFDKYKVLEHEWLKEKKEMMYMFNIHLTNVIAGVLFVLLGLVFIFFNGTEFLASVDFFNMQEALTSAQEALIHSMNVPNRFVVLLLMAAFLIILVAWQKGILKRKGRK